MVLPAAPTLRLHWTDWLARAGLLALAGLLGVGLMGPLLALLGQAFEPGVVDGQRQGAWQHFVAYLGSPALLDSLWHSLWVSVLVTLIVLPFLWLAVLSFVANGSPSLANYQRMLTERNEALVTADRLKDAFVQNVSYELRSPERSAQCCQPGGCAHGHDASCVTSLRRAGRQAVPRQTTP